MGRHYSIELYFPYANIPAAFEAVYTVLDAKVHPHSPMKIRLADGSAITIPFEIEPGSWAVDPLRLLRGNELRANLCISFPVDDAVRRYEHVPDWADRASIGGIDLSVTAGEKYVCFDFWAVTSSVSLMFAESSAVQSLFHGMLNAAGGIVALLIAENSALPVLGQPGRTVVLPDEDDYFIEELMAEGRFVQDIDRIVADILPQLDGAT
jgi:hypothetical protein